MSCVLGACLGIQKATILLRKKKELVFKIGKKKFYFKTLNIFIWGFLFYSLMRSAGIGFHISFVFVITLIFLFKTGDTFKEGLCNNHELEPKPKEYINLLENRCVREFSWCLRIQEICTDLKSRLYSTGISTNEFISIGRCKLPF